MRADAPDILQHLGFVLDVDFVAIGTKDGAEIKWLSARPQPDEKALDAAAPTAEAAKQAEEAKRQESNTARDDAKRALAALDTIIAEAPTATNAQMRMYVELLARIAKHHILATVGR